MLRPRARRLEVSRFAHNRALHYLARQRDYRLSDLLRQQLTEVVEGLRRQYRSKGERPPF